MNKEELELAAQELGIDFQSMSLLQDNYLNYKKIQNTKDLHEYLVTKGRIRGDNLNLPNSLKKYFVKDPNNTMKGSESSQNMKTKGKTPNVQSQGRMKTSQVDFSPEKNHQF